ncbi:MAG: porphobilinogen synthase, partial [bacterium]|nr:porphobilinogen synthase [bacterium]
MTTPALVGGQFPNIRPRRLRRTAALRRLVRETELSASRFVYPLFVTHGEGIQREVPSMPGIFQ